MHYGEDKDGGVEAPITLGGLFPDSDEEDSSTQSVFEQVSEVQSLTIAGLTFEVEQLAYHSHNANKVWPGTFALTEYIKQNSSRYPSETSRLLEIGSATGVAFVFMVALHDRRFSPVYSDPAPLAAMCRSNGNGATVAWLQLNRHQRYRRCGGDGADRQELRPQRPPLPDAHPTYLGHAMASRDSRQILDRCRLGARGSRR